jgi:lysozyme family protein
MADFQPAFENTMKWEDPTGQGKVTHDPTLANPAAVARFGINSAANPDAAADGFYAMPLDQALEYAANLYRNTYWAKVCGSQIQDQSVANKFFDLAVNSGWVQATKIVQQALGMPVDGVCGPQTIGAVNTSDPAQLLRAVREQALKFYQDLAASHPQDQADLKGWEARADS